MSGLNRREQNELLGDTGQVLSGKNNSGNRKVFDYLRESPAFNKGRINTFTDDLEPISTIIERLGQSRGSSPRIGDMSDAIRREIDKFESKIGNRGGQVEVVNRLTAAAIVPLETVVVGSKILRVISDCFNKDSFTGLSKKILDAINENPSFIFGINTSEDNNKLRELFLGNETDTIGREGMRLILGPYLQGLMLVELSERVLKASREYNRESGRALKRSQDKGNMINPEKTYETQEELNFILKEIAELEQKAMGELGKTSGELAGVGVIVSDPVAVRGTLTINKGYSESAGKMYLLLKKRDKLAKIVRGQMSLGVEIMSNYVLGITYNTTSNLVDNIAFLARAVGIQAMANVALRQTIAAAAAMKVTIHYLTNGTLSNNSELENQICEDFKSGENIIEV